MKNTKNNVRFNGVKKIDLDSLDYVTVSDSYSKIEALQRVCSKKAALELDKLIENLPIIVNPSNCPALKKIERKFGTSVTIRHSFGKLFINYSVELDFVNRRAESFEILDVVSNITDTLSSSDFGYFLSSRK